jgi:hypothetical protein
MKRKGASVVEVLIIVGIIALIAGLIWKADFRTGEERLGVGAYGPTQFLKDVTVTDKHRDTASEGMGDKQKTKTHYMVSTDQGVFEVDNGKGLIWNADELYGKLNVGRRYNLTVKGNKVLDAKYQYYPYIVEVTPVPDAKQVNPE